jgi:ATP-binding cassette subfamily B protein
MKELKRLLPYLKKYRKRLYLGFLFVTVSNICSTYAPRVVGDTVDMVSSGDFAMQAVLWNIGYLIALTIGSGLFMFLTRRTIIVSSRLIEYDLRKDLLDSIESRPMSFFHRHSTGSLMAYATNDIPAARDFLGPAIMYSANTITTFVFALSFMLTLSITISLVALIPLPLIAITTYFIGRKVHVAFREVQDQFSDLTTRAQEAFSGIKVIRAYVREAFEQSKFKNLSYDYYQKNMRLARLQSITMPVLMVMVGLSQIAVLGYGGLRVIEGQATLGELTQFFIYLNLLIWPVAAIGWITNIIQRAAASAGRLGKIIDVKDEKDEHLAENKSIENIKGEIRFRNVTMRYAEDIPPAIENLDFHIPPSGTFGIVGPVGSGKSTIVNLLPGLYKPDAGQIIIDGRDINDIPRSQLRGAIGVVQQDTYLFSDTIAGNIGFGCPGCEREDIIEAAKIAMLHEDVEKFPDGYDTILGERGVTLSGGQRQRVAIARALLRRPKILILDDALSAVDTETESKIFEGLARMLSDCTTIIISHRLSSVKNADEIIFIDSGRIIEKGSHEELIGKNGKYADIYRRQKLASEIESL